MQLFLFVPIGICFNTLFSGKLRGVLKVAHAMLLRFTWYFVVCTNQEVVKFGMHVINLLVVKEQYVVIKEQYVVLSMYNVARIACVQCRIVRKIHL